MKKWVKVVLPIVFIIVLIVVTADFMSDKNKLYEKNSTAMGTVINQKIYGKDAEKSAREINDMLTDLDCNVFSSKVKSSLTYKLNGNKILETDNEDFLNLTNMSLDFSKNCNGAYDITMGELSLMWGIGTEKERIPSEKEINTALKNVGYEKITVDNTLIKIGENQIVDFGASAKGYGADKAKEILQKNNIKKATVSVGGSILVYGASEKEPFKIGIKNPFEKETKIIATLELFDCFVSTSGNYERYFEKDGVRYHHILNSKTGYPAKSEFASVTVVANNGALSDMLSTACYILDFQSSLKLLEKYDAQAVFIFNDGSIKITNGLKNKFHSDEKDFETVK